MDEEFMRQIKCPDCNETCIKHGVLKSAQMTSLIAIIVGICVFIYLGYLEKKNQTVIIATEPTVKSKKRK